MNCGMFGRADMRNWVKNRSLVIRLKNVISNTYLIMPDGSTEYKFSDMMTDLESEKLAIEVVRYLEKEDII